MGFYAPFQSRHMQFENLNTTTVSLTVEYWNGSAWVATVDFVDQTLGLTRSGFLSWTNQADWVASKQAPINDISLFWIRVSVDLDLDAGTSLQSVLNLFSDDDSLRLYYPELVNDTRFLPQDRTDYLDQHVAAKDLVVLKLKQRRLIKDERQILDINEVFTAATHACAYLILHPVATSETIIELAERALKAFENEVSQLALSVDQSDDGTLSEAERVDFGETFIERR
jgi:hypothetical protein